MAGRERPLRGRSDGGGELRGNGGLGWRILDGKKSERSETAGWR